MHEPIRHRGPDGFGIYQDENVSLGSARLSIIDLSGGDQPISNEDGTVWIIFNGEIFNYVELRPALEAKGHHFATHSDTEVIGICTKITDRLPEISQWAVCSAIWDANRRRLFLARSVGIRPCSTRSTGAS
jgi:asparagine synthase (glutamine-hydrolysing)